MKWPPLLERQKRAFFFGIFHHIDQRLERYLCHIASNVVFELFYGLWHTFYTSKISTKEVQWSQIRGSWWTVNIPGHVVLKKSDSDWPRRFPDLIPPTFFFRDFWRVKFMPTSQIPYKSSKTINIRPEMAAISPETLANVMENAKKRARFCPTNNGGHLIDIVFGNQLR